jgi:hypothetical protein
MEEQTADIEIYQKFCQIGDENVTGYEIVMIMWTYASSRLRQCTWLVAMLGPGPFSAFEVVLENDVLA